MKSLIVIWALAGITAVGVYVYATTAVIALPEYNVTPGVITTMELKGSDRLMIFGNPQDAIQGHELQNTATAHDLQPAASVQPNFTQTIEGHALQPAAQGVELQ